MDFTRSMISIPLGQCATQEPQVAQSQAVVSTVAWVQVSRLMFLKDLAGAVIGNPAPRADTGTGAALHAAHEIVTHIFGHGLKNNLGFSDDFFF